MIKIKFKTNRDGRKFVGNIFKLDRIDRLLFLLGFRERVLGILAGDVRVVVNEKSTGHL